MMGFDETITIYHEEYEPETKVAKWFKRVYDSCSWCGGQSITLSNGAKSKDGYKVRIPLSVYDGANICNGDIVVLGEGKEVVNDIAEITKKYTDCFKITGVRPDNLKRLLPHLKIEGV